MRQKGVIMIPHSRPTLDDADAQAVLAVMKSGLLVQGEQVAGFEVALSSFIGVRHGAAVSSGTAALHLSLIALGVGTGDEVIIPSYVCSALLHAVHYVGALPVFADIEEDTFNISAADIKKRITKKTAVIIVPHLFGLSANLTEILSFGIPVIEDCAQSLGSHYMGRCTGSFGVLSVFSFYATKMIATGEGGMVLSNDAGLIERIKDLRAYDERHDHQLRFNYKMTDLQAALGRNQLKKIDLFMSRRRDIAGRYDRMLKNTGVRIPFTPPDCSHIYYRYCVLDGQATRFMDEMNQEGIACRRPVFKPLHRCMNRGGYGATDRIWEKAVSIPIYPSLTDEEVMKIGNAVEKCLR
jgi:perosamine synthetase